VKGCDVNGPGEANDADLGVAWGGDYIVIFRQGELVKRVKMTEAAGGLLPNVEPFISEPAES